MGDIASGERRQGQVLRVRTLGQLSAFAVRAAGTWALGAGRATQVILAVLAVAAVSPPVHALDGHEATVLGEPQRSLRRQIAAAAGPLQAAQRTLQPLITRERSLAANLDDALSAARSIVGEFEAGSEPSTSKAVRRIHRALLQVSRAEVLLLNLIEREELPPTERRIALGMLHDGQRALSDASWLAHKLRLKVHFQGQSSAAVPELVTVTLQNRGSFDLGTTRLLVYGPPGVVSEARGANCFATVPAGGSVQARFRLKTATGAGLAGARLTVHITYFSRRSKAVLTRQCDLN